MPHGKNQNGSTRTQNTRTFDSHAAILIDFDDTVSTISGQANGRVSGTDLLIELVEEIRSRINSDVGAEVILTAALGDFTGEINEREEILKHLYYEQVETRHLCSRADSEATVMQMALEAADLVNQRTDIATIVLVSGKRSYFQVANWLRRKGRRVVLVSLSWPDELPDKSFLHWKALDLFSEATRRQWQSAPQEKRRLEYSADDDADFVHGLADPADWEEVTDPSSLQALEIIEEYFGHYEEVYLTPLLRKMSEMNPFDDTDPKVLISDLEATGAVWLEKRRGFPHDYTVLIVNQDHPSVVRVKEEVQDRLADELGLEDEFEDDDSYEKPSGDSLDPNPSWNN